jgi:cyclic beta-1,2-glucan synthetase
MGAMSKLERFRGHFFNWYDTRTTQPLLPSYVSTVDSGNLAGHLVALANAIESVIARPLWSAERVRGIKDALALAGPSGQRAALLSAIETARGLPPGPVDARGAGAGGVPLPLASGSSLRRGLACDCRAMCSHLRDVAALSGDASEGEAAAIPAHAARLQQLSGSEGPMGVRTVPRTWSAAPALAAAARQLAYGMDFAFLRKPQRMLLSFGFNVGESRLDAGDYDLLASEARLASYIAIAKRDVAARHWFRLDRHSVAMGDSTALLSWSGSMFEYLMPALSCAHRAVACWTVHCRWRCARTGTTQRPAECPGEFPSPPPTRAILIRRISTHPSVFPRSD